jgi:putative FmdB family regulatory protein
MPLYEYTCRACEHAFEVLVRNAEPPTCPACHSGDLERRLSVFAAHAGGAPRTEVAPCGTCGDPRGPGACSMN